MKTKVEETLKKQKEHLANLKMERESLETRFLQVREAISQITGSVAALEYLLAEEDPEVK